MAQWDRVGLSCKMIWKIWSFFNFFYCINNADECNWFLLSQTRDCPCSDGLLCVGWDFVGWDFPSSGEVKERLSLLGWAAVCWAGLSLTR